MADLKIQGEVVVDASQAESALDRVGSKAESMAAGVGQSAGQAGKAVDGIGDKAETGAQKFTRAEARMRDSIRKSTLELQQFGKTASEKLEFKLADKGLDASKFQPYLAELRKVEAAHQAASGTLDGMGMSAKATAAALRGVPAQFTDIVTALQGGQRPLTVLMQQGGQLKDMFGGVGAAARALGGYVLGLINPFTLAAAAVGAIALAYNQGSKEQDAFVKSIVTTGNISGVTAGQLGQYARAISSVAGTQSKAAETLAAFVAEGVRGGAMLEKYAQTAIEWEKATGQSVAKTAEQFASLQKDPLSSVLKLNEGTNFLTESVYKQIKALDEQGRSADASKVAMDALNTAMESRSKTIEQNLGYIERAWRGIASAAKSGWDAMLNVGRADSLDTQIDNMRAKIAQAKGQDKNRPFSMPWDTSLADLEKQLSYLTEQERMLRRGAEAESERNKQLAARIEFDKAGEQYLSKRARMEREIAKATNEAAAAGVGQAELEQRIASIREKFAEKNTEGMKAQRAAAKLLAEDMAALAKMAGLSPDFYKEWDKLNDMFKRGKLDVDGLTQAQAKLLEKQPVIAAETKAQADAQKQVNASIDAYRSALQAVAKEEAARVDGIAKSNADLREQIATMGLTNQQIRQRTIELNRATIAEKEQQLARLQSGFTSTREQAALEEEIRLLKERNGLLSDQGVKEQYVAAQQEMTDTWTSIDRTAHDVFVNIFEDGAGTFKRLGQTLKSALLDMLYQLTVKRWIINIGASFGATGGIFGEGHGGAGGLFSTASNANSLFSGASLISNWMGTGAGAGVGTLAYGNMIGAMGGDGLGAFIAANGGWGTSGAGALANSAGSAFGEAAAGIAAVAAPLIVGILAERNSRDRYGGAAYATSNWQSDAFVNAVGADFNALTGDIPNREALIERAIAAGIERSTVDLFNGNDRALLHYVRMAEDPNRNEFGGLPDPRKLIADGNLYNADFYRGQGFASPEEMGWWNNKGGDLTAVDPRVVEASRALSLSIVGPLTDMARMLGDAGADFRVTTGFANRGKGALWGALDIQRGGETIGGFDQSDFKDVQEYMRAVYSEAMDAFSAMDLPEWARGQVEGAQTAMDALTGDKIGEQAAALYQQATGGISATFAAIEKMINLFPDFAEASQDAVYALGELTGGLDNLASAYGSYLSNFYSEEERRQLMFNELDSELDKLGIDTIPRTRAEFRELVSAQDLTTESGRAAFAALIGLSGAFADIVPAAQTAAEALAAVQQALDDAVTAAQSRTDDVWSRLQDLLQDQIDAWQEIADEARSVFDTASSAARDIRGQVDSTRLWDAAQASVWIDQALAAARATGVLPDSSELSTAIGSARNLSMADYASVADYERDQLILAGRLDELGDIAGTQASFAEQQIELMQRELEQWRTQIDVLRGIDLGIDTVAEAVTAIQAAIEAERAARAAAEAASDTPTGTSTGKPSYSSGGYGSWGGGSGSVSGGSYHSVPPQGFASSAEEAAAWAAQYAAIGDGHYYTYRHPNGGWTIGYGTYSGPAQLDLQQYAKGTDYVPYDMVAQIHQGERIIPAADNAAITRAMTQGGGSGDAALRAEVARLNAQVAELVAITKRQHALLDQVTAGGNAMLTEAA